MSKVFTTAVIQHPPIYLNLEASIDKACQLVEEAAALGANIILFPETWLPGYPVWLDYAPEAGLWDHAGAKALYQVLVENALEIPSPALGRLQAAAQQTNTLVVVGAHEKAGGTLYNTTIFVESNGRVTTHRKLIPTYTERLLWGRGDGSTLSVVETEYGRVGGLICWEHWMPLARAAMHAKRELLHVAQWPAVKDLHQIASRHYAFEGQCFVAAVGCVLSKKDVLNGYNSLPTAPAAGRDLLASIPGEPTRLLLNGGSAIIAPSSEYLARPLFDEVEILTAEIDPTLATQGHLTIDTDGHYARPDVFRLEVDERPQVGVRFRAE